MKRKNDFTWAHLMPDHALILDNLGLRISQAGLPSWPKYKPYRDWYCDMSLLARFRKWYTRTFHPEKYERTRANYEKWRFRYMLDLLNETIRQGDEMADNPDGPFGYMAGTYCSDTGEITEPDFG